MRHEALAPGPGSESSVSIPAICTFDPSGSSGQFDELLTERTATLGASPLSHMRARSMAILMGAVASSVTLASNPAMTQALVPESLAVPGFVGVNAETKSATDRTGEEVRRLLRRAMAAIEQEPVEDGISHPAERWLAEALDKGGAGALCAQMLEGPLGTSLIASLVRLLGRLSFEEPIVKEQILWQALASPSIELRDAAVQAAELWADRTAIEVLRGHAEPVPWLAEYISRLLQQGVA
jgi:hypothetical protein